MKTLLCLVATLILGSAVVNAQDTVRCTYAMDLAFVIDNSGSIKADAFADLKVFLNKMIDLVDNYGPEHVQISVISFGSNASITIPFGRYSSKDDLKQAVEGLQQLKGATNTFRGMQEMRRAFQEGGRQDTSRFPRVAVYIADGRWTDDFQEPYPEARAAREQDQISIFSVGIGPRNKINEQDLRDISGRDDILFVSNYGELIENLNEVAEKTCLTTTTTTTTPAPQPDFITDCLNQADITFVLDSSGSIDEVNFKKTKEFIKELVREVRIQEDLARVSLITFGDDVMPQFNFSSIRSQAEALTKIDEVKYVYGKTNTAAALRYLHEKHYTGNAGGTGDRDNIPNIAIVLTDGGSDNEEETLEEAYNAKKAGIHLITVGMGDWTDEMELSGMASYPYEKNKMDVADFDALSSIKDRVSNLICNKQKECDSRPCANGGQCIDGMDMFWCRCRSPWGGRTCEKRCNKRADIVFALDASGSITGENFRTQLDFVQNAIVGLNVGQDIRVGLLTYGSSPRVRFNLGEYDIKLDVLNAMSVYYTGGTTNTAEALKTVTDSMFTAAQGDRDDAQNILLLFTDGQSDNRTATWEEARRARHAGIQILTIGVGSGVRQTELEGIATAPTESNILLVNNFPSLESQLDIVTTAVCSDNCQNYRCENGGTPVDRLRGCECLCPSGTRGKTCEKRCTSYVDLTVVVDSSGSIRGERFPKVLDFISDVLSDFPLEMDGGEAKIGAVTFSESAKLEFNLNTYKSRQDVLHAIKQFKFVGGKTNGADAIRIMQQDVFSVSVGDRSDATNIALMFTDGNSNVNEERTIPNAIEARVQGTHIIVFGVGTMINMLEIEGIASKPYNDTVHIVRSWTDLPSIVEDLKDATCDARNECDSNPCRNGGRCVDRYKKYLCECFPPNTGPTCERVCTRSMDLTLVLDVSGSVEEVQNLVLKFATEVVYGLPIGTDLTRVALIYYSDDAVVHFYLDTYSTKQGALNAMVLRSAGGATNTQAAITLANQRVHTASRGDRNGIDNIMVVVTDGSSNIEPLNTIPAAEAAKARGIQIYSVALGESPDMEEIDGISSGDRYVIKLPNEAEISRASDELLVKLCQS